MIYWESILSPESTPPPAEAPPAEAPPAIKEASPTVQGIRRQAISAERDSHILSIGYSAAESALEVEYKDGTVHQWRSVPLELFEELQRSVRVGSFLAKRIYKSFPHYKLPPNPTTGQPTSTRALGASLDVT